MATVLVVEDDPDIRALLELRLRRAGHHVREAGSGEQALALLRTVGPPDIAVLDVLMPGMTGVDLLTVLRRDPAYRAMPALFLSGRMSETDQGAAAALGARYLRKPVVLAELVQAVGDALSTRVGVAEPVAPR